MDYGKIGQSILIRGVGVNNRVICVNLDYFGQACETGSANFRGTNPDPNIQIRNKYLPTLLLEDLATKPIFVYLIFKHVYLHKLSILYQHFACKGISAILHGMVSGTILLKYRFAVYLS